MADSFAITRFRARLAPPAAPPKLLRQPYRRTPEECSQLLLNTQTMAEIRIAADMLGLTFNEAYRLRARLYDAMYL